LPSPTASPPSFWQDAERDRTRSLCVRFVQQLARPWIDAGVERPSEEPLTIIQVGALDIRLEAAEAQLDSRTQTPPAPSHI